MSVEELLDEGNTHLALGEMEQACACYQRAVEVDPGHFEAWHALALATLKLGRNTESIAAGLRAVELRPGEQMAYTSLSIAYARNGQIQEAEATSAKAKVVSWGGRADRVG